MHTGAGGFAGAGTAPTPTAPLDGCARTADATAGAEASRGRHHSVSVTDETPSQRTATSSRQGAMLRPGRCRVARSDEADAVAAAAEKEAAEAPAARTAWLLVVASNAPQRKTAKAVGVFAAGAGGGTGGTGGG